MGATASLRLFLGTEEGRASQRRAGDAAGPDKREYANTHAYANFCEMLTYGALLLLLRRSTSTYTVIHACVPAAAAATSQQFQCV